MGGSGLSSGKGGGGGKASAASNASIKAKVSTIASSYRSIDQASPKIKAALDSAPVGTELVFEAYYSRDGMLQSTYTKKNSSEWEHSWGVRGGKTYWTSRNSSRITASNIYNDVTAR